MRSTLPERAQHDVEDLDLVARSQSGDSRAFEVLYKRYASDIQTYMRTALKSIDEAEDATQDVFLKVLEALPKFEVRDVPFRIWLFQVARNHAINHLSKHSRITVESLETIDRRRERAINSVEHEVINRLSERSLLASLGCLPPAQRRVVFLRYVMALSVAETAEILGSNPNAVRNLQHRAFKSLKPRFEALSA